MLLQTIKTKELVTSQEQPCGEAAVAVLITEAFRTDQHSSGTEAGIVDQLRKTENLSLSSVAVQKDDDNLLIGYLALASERIEDVTLNWYGLGPVAPSSDWQNQGVSKALIESALEILETQKIGDCVRLGEPAYYTDFEFRRRSHLILEGEPQEYFMAHPMNGQRP